MNLEKMLDGVKGFVENNQAKIYALVGAGVGYAIGTYAEVPVMSEIGESLCSAYTLGITTGLTKYKIDNPDKKAPEETRFYDRK